MFFLSGLGLELMIHGRVLKSTVGAGIQRFPVATITIAVVIS